MPLVRLDQLPPAARVWVFASTRALDADAGARLLAEVDRFLVQWQAHGRPLTCARGWRDDHFLTVAVDERDAGASGCSIDGLYRSLRALESALDTRLIGGGEVFYRDAHGSVRAVTRAEFAELATRGVVTQITPVFDTTVATLGDWAERFEVPAGQGWHARLLATSRTG